MSFLYPAAVAEPEVAAMVGEVVLLDGRPSTDPDGVDGRPVEWGWWVSERPVGSVAEPVESAAGGEPDDRATPTAELVPDVAGRYVVDLQVTDADNLNVPGDPRCDLAPVQIVLEVAAAAR